MLVGTADDQLAWRQVTLRTVEVTSRIGEGQAPGLTPQCVP
jgi:hypothetical protein